MSSLKPQPVRQDVVSESLARLSAQDMLAGYAAGRFTPRDVVDDVIAALDKTDQHCNVVVTDMYDSARKQAEQATAAWRSGEARGALAGVPVTIKDLIYVAGVPARGGAPMYKDLVPTVDAAVVSTLREAGAILTCKTTTCESGYKLTADSPVSGITRNPWHLDRTSGGSSGGAAAAVAAGCGPLALGTDGVGSIRVPSSFCGVFGLKPTFGLVPRSPGFFPPSWATLAHTGPIARTVADAALLLDVITRPDARDPGNVPVSAGPFAANPILPAGLKIAFSADLGFAAVDPEVRAGFEGAVETLRGLGALLIDDHPGLDPDILESVLKPIAFSEQAGAVAHCPPSALAQSEPDYRAVVEQGRRYSSIEYVAASHRRAQLRGRFLDLFGRVDVLVTPTVATTAFAAGTIGVGQIDGQAVDSHLGWSPFTWPINLAGLPAATIPCGFDRDGLPIGLQVVVPWFRENLLLSVAAAVEQAAPWAATWPALPT